MIHACIGKNMCGSCYKLLWLGAICRDLYRLNKFLSSHNKSPSHQTESSNLRISNWGPVPVRPHEQWQCACWPVNSWIAWLRLQQPWSENPPLYIHGTSLVYGSDPWMVDFLWNQWIGKSTSMDPMDPVFSWGFMILGHRSREQTFNASLSSGGLLTTLLPSVAFEIAMHPKSRRFMEIWWNLLSGIEYLLKSTSANLHTLRLMSTCPQIFPHFHGLAQ